MSDQRAFKGIWISAEMWLNRDLSVLEKILLLEIDSLDSSEKGCFKSNEALAEFIGVSSKRLSNMLTSLKKRGLVEQCFFDGRVRGLRVSKSLGLGSRVDQNNESAFPKSTLSAFPKTGKQLSRKREHSNTVEYSSNINTQKETQKKGKLNNDGKAHLNNYIFIRQTGSEINYRATGESLLDEFPGQQLTIEAECKKHGLTPVEVIGQFRLFLLDSAGREIIYNNRTELFSHFSNWLRFQNVEPESIDKEFTWFMEQFNKAARKEYGHTKKARALFVARRKEGFTGDQMKEAIRKMFDPKNKFMERNQWAMATPEYLLSKDNLNKELARRL